MLDTKDVAEMFKRCNLAVYAEARRIYYREVNLNPCKKYPKQVLQRIEWWFWDWFAYDCAVSGIGLTAMNPKIYVSNCSTVRAQVSRHS